MTLAPIVLFVYNRPSHTEQTLEALMANDLANESTLFIYADGPKNFLPELKSQIEETRRVIKKKKWCKEVFVIESDINKGLADSIVEGVSKIVDQYGKVIVLEDDIVTSPGFLKYMNNALNVYEHDPQVMHISGYMYPVVNTIENDTVFLRILSCWGWATWKRAWKSYSNDINRFINLLSGKESIKTFNIMGDAHFYDQLLGNQKFRLKTWAVRWYASWYFEDGYSLFPKTTLVKNIGHDNTGVHCKETTHYNTDIIAASINVVRKPINEDFTIKSLINDFYRKEKKILKKSSGFNLKDTIQRKIYSMISKIIHKLLTIYNLYYGEKSMLNGLQRLDNSFVSLKSKVYGHYQIVGSFIDDYTYIASNASLSLVRVGKFCSIGPNLKAGHGIHPLNGVSTSPMFYSPLRQNGISLSYQTKVVEQRPIFIGNDVFIGMNVTILDGITIGDGAVIGAGAVVSKNIPPFAIAVGNPIKVLRYRFSEDKIEDLLKIKWWEWDEKKLHNVEQYFDKVDDFIKDNI